MKGENGARGGERCTAQVQGAVPTQDAAAVSGHPQNKAAIPRRL